MNLISPNLNIAIKACEKASKKLIRDFGEIEKLQVSSKGPTDFVTNADIKAEKTIIEELKKAKPYYSILSEENGLEQNKDKNNTWIIDPIDGTVNFLHGVPHFAISVGLRSDNEILLGVIYDPIKDELFYAEKNNGAFLNNQKIRVSNRNKINECLFASSGNQNNLSIPFRKSGCATLDMASVAAGRFDGFFQKNLNIWDIAAGIVLVKEAGGILNDIELAKPNNHKIITSSPNINSKLIEKLDNF